MSASIGKAKEDTQKTIGRPDIPLAIGTASDCSQGTAVLK